MHARQVICRALIVAAIPLGVGADGPPDTPKPPTVPSTGPADSPASAKDAGAARPATTPPASPAITPGTMVEANRLRLGAEARLRELDASDPKRDNPAHKPIREVFDRRLKLLAEWKEAVDHRAAAEHPTPSPEQVAAELKADLEKTQAVLEQAGKAPDALLPEAFGPTSPGAASKTSEARLAEMKEAIDAARLDIKERGTELATLRGDAAKAGTGEVATLRVERDKIHQSTSALAAGRLEREAAINAAGSPEARELARERFSNYEWECRVEAERLAAKEAQIALAAKRGDLVTLQVQAKAAHVNLDRRLLAEMERRYASQSERQQADLKQAVAKEVTKAAQTVDVLERYRAKRSAELLELEAEAVAYEKASATTVPGLSVGEQSAMADAMVSNFEVLKRSLDDGVVSPLDLLRLKNEFRRIGPARAALVRGELATVKGALTTYSNALADAEIDLVNDERDDRYDREALLDKLPASRQAEARAMLDAMEVRHRALLGRNRDVLSKLAQRADDTQTQVLRRIKILDEQYAFIRTHIFWVRDAEPPGLATLAHAQDESIRAARGLVRLAAEPWDRTLWGRVSPDFILAVVGLVALPWPLRLARRALDRLRLAAPDPALADADAARPATG